jgi:hypothetical protein
MFFSHDNDLNTAFMPSATVRMVPKSHSEANWTLQSISSYITLAHICPQICNNVLAIVNNPGSSFVHVSIF